jgi:hypothetical protein
MIQQGAAIKAMYVAGVTNKIGKNSSYVLNICIAIPCLLLLSLSPIIFRSKSRHKLHHVSVESLLAIASKGKATFESAMVKDIASTEIQAINPTMVAAVRCTPGQFLSKSGAELLHSSHRGRLLGPLTYYTTCGVPIGSSKETLARQ